MRVLLGIGCFGMIPAIVWLTLRLRRNPELSFWKHPIMLWGIGGRWGLLLYVAPVVALLFAAGITVIFDP